MKQLLILSVALCLGFYVNCTQHLYKFVPDHCLIKDVNRSLFRNFADKCTKLSRTELFLNLTFNPNVDILSDQMAQVKITGYQFRSNEYRKGPIEFMMGLCSAAKTKQFDIPQMLSKSNIACPVKKGVNYYIYDLSPNATNMPPLLPEGKWLLELKFLYMNKYQIFTLEWYSGVEYPILFR